MQAALELIETKIAFLERTTADLSDVVFRQHREILALQERITGLQERLNSLQAEDVPRSIEQELPPHY